MRRWCSRTCTCRRRMWTCAWRCCTLCTGRRCGGTPAFCSWASLSLQPHSPALQLMTAPAQFAPPAQVFPPAFPSSSRFPISSSFRRIALLASRGCTADASGPRAAEESQYAPFISDICITEHQFLYLYMCCCEFIKNFIFSDRATRILWGSPTMTPFPTAPTCCTFHVQPLRVQGKGHAGCQWSDGWPAGGDNVCSADLLDSLNLSLYLASQADARPLAPLRSGLGSPWPAGAQPQLGP